MKTTDVQQKLAFGICKKKTLIGAIMQTKLEIVKAAWNPAMKTKVVMQLNAEVVIAVGGKTVVALILILTPTTQKTLHGPVWKEVLRLL